MTEHQQNHSSEDLAGFLSTAQNLAEAGNYHDALATVRDAEKLHPRNIYVLAFERQVEQLTELSLAGKLGDEERTDILESIPGIVARALESSGEPSLPTAPPPDASTAEGARAERAAAHEWLKNQYFQHAHEYVKKGEYSHALAEIRRVFIIDPENQIARDFELQIGELSRIRNESVGVPAPSARSAAKPAAQTTQPATGEPSPKPVASGPRKSADTPPTGRKKLRPLSIILLFLALALLGFATVFLIKKLETPTKSTPRSTIRAS